MSLTYPSDAINRGQSFEVASSYNILPGASLTTTAPNGSFDLTGRLALEADVGGRACVGVCASGHARIVDFDANQTLLKVDKTDLSTTFGGPFGSQVGLKFPSVSTSGTLVAGALVSSGQDRFADISVNATNAIAEAFGLPPLSASIDIGIGDVGYNTSSLRSSFRSGTAYRSMESMKNRRVSARFFMLSTSRHYAGFRTIPGRAIRYGRKARQYRGGGARPPARLTRHSLGRFWRKVSNPSPGR